MLKTIGTNKQEKLIGQCIKGNRKAQFELYKQHSKTLYNASLRIVQDTQEAEDIMQEAFLTAFEKLDTYQGEVPIGAWLRRIAVNRSLDALRKRKLDFEVQDEIKDEPEEYEPEPNVNIDIKTIKKCVDQLPDNYRTVLTLYLLEGYDHEEISTILKISNSTSRSQYARARKKLQTFIREELAQTAI
ncbi:MAG: RNA polymerase sigma factor [Salinivirgaceae bacterium]|jgi:RNA polymerase sigma factor (sigma-70 family)|nr:RNA polymerase sigma factor [Salinivirgaceae bacterium]